MDRCGRGFRLVVFDFSFHVGAATDMGLLFNPCGFRMCQRLEIQKAPLGLAHPHAIDLRLDKLVV